MYSTTIYLFGDKFSQKPSFLNWKETLPTGIEVDQKKLTEMVTVGALLYLQKQGFIDIKLEEGKVLFIKTKSIKVKPLKEASPDLYLFEGFLMKHLLSDQSLHHLIRRVIGRESYNPWGDLLSLVKADLLKKGILQKEEKGKVLFIKTYKNTLSNGIPKEEEQRLAEIQSALSNIQKNAELYKKIMAEINAGIDAQLIRSNRDND